MRSWDALIERAGKVAGLLIVMIGAGVYIATERAEPIIFSTGVLLFLGGAGAGLSDRLPGRRGPSSKEET